MTVEKVIERIQQNKGGVDVTREQLIEYIRTCEYILLQDVISGREGGDDIIDAVNSTDFYSGQNIELTAQAPFDIIYEQYAAAQIDLLTEDGDRYMNDLAVFRDTYLDFKRHWWRTHRQTESYRYA